MVWSMVLLILGAVASVSQGSMDALPFEWIMAILFTPVGLSLACKGVRIDRWRSHKGTRWLGVHLGAYLAYALPFLPDRVVGWAWSCPGLGLGVNPLVAPIHIQLQGLARIGRICDPPRWIRLQKTCE